MGIQTKTEGVIIAELIEYNNLIKKLSIIYLEKEYNNNIKCQLSI